VESGGARKVSAHTGQGNRLKRITQSERRVMLRGGREPRDNGHDKEDQSRDRNHNIGQRSYFGVANEITNGPDEGVSKSQEQNRGADKNKGDQDEQSVPGADSAQPEEKEPADRPANADPHDQFYG
jgi:hypothetical protein